MDLIIADLPTYINPTCPTAWERGVRGTPWQFAVTHDIHAPDGDFSGLQQASWKRMTTMALCRSDGAKCSQAL
jgi:hypothetical protein